MELNPGVVRTVRPRPHAHVAFALVSRAFRKDTLSGPRLRLTVFGVVRTYIWLGASVGFVLLWRDHFDNWVVELNGAVVDEVLAWGWKILVIA